MTLSLKCSLRQLVISSGFFAQQQAAVIVLVAGLLVAVVIFIIAIVPTLRNISAWQRVGAFGQARAALLALGITALVVLLPVILTIVVPQNPAP